VKTREELFTQLKTELDAHARVEETIFYPELERPTKLTTLPWKPSRSIVWSNSFSANWKKLDKGNEQWTARFTVLKENVEHHVEEEEGEDVS